MSKKEVKVTPVRRTDPNYGLYVLALIALARQLNEAQVPPAAEVPEQEVRHD